MENNESEVVFEFDLPDFEESDIDVDISDNMLTINASKKHSEKVEKDDFYQHSACSRNYNYSTTLPEINTSEMKKEFKDGVLKISIPKK